MRKLYDVDLSKDEKVLEQSDYFIPLPEVIKTRTFGFKLVRGTKASLGVKEIECGSLIFYKVVVYLSLEGKESKGLSLTPEIYPDDLQIRHSLITFRDACYKIVREGAIANVLCKASVRFDRVMNENGVLVNDDEILVSLCTGKYYSNVRTSVREIKDFIKFPWMK